LNLDDVHDPSNQKFSEIDRMEENWKKYFKEFWGKTKDNFGTMVTNSQISC
jgi:hypothetical protein